MGSTVCNHCFHQVAYTVKIYLVKIYWFRWAFNITLFIVGVFGTASGGSPSYTALCTFASLWSIGVGGNLPVDSAIFLEFVPGSHQYL